MKRLNRINLERRRIRLANSFLFRLLPKVEDSINIGGGWLGYWEEDQRTKSKELSYWLAEMKTMFTIHCQVKRNPNGKRYIH